VTDAITWHPQDNDLQHLSSTLNGWYVQIWDFGSHPDRPPHPAGKPFAWSVSPAMYLTDGGDREGHASTLEAAKAEAEQHLRELAVNPAPHDEALAAIAEAMPRPSH
jgi:hypothetical protein